MQGTLWQQCGGDRRLGLREASIVQAKDEEKDDTGDQAWHGIRKTWKSQSQKTFLERIQKTTNDHI